MNVHDLDSWIAKTITQFSSTKINKLAPGAFACQSSLVNVNIPNVTVLPRFAFYQCSLLSTLTTGTLTVLQGDCLCGCSALSNLDLTHVTEISAYAICGCNALTSLDLSGLQYLYWAGVWDAYGKVWLPSTCNIRGSNFNHEGNGNGIIYTDATEKPSNWVDGWNQTNYPVIWGATHEDFLNA